MEDYVVYYLKKLKQICKLIIFCNDNELSNKELSKLKGIVDYTIIGRHNEYDFGSYKHEVFNYLNPCLIIIVMKI